MPKPHGHGMRAVLDFRAANLNSVPDRYTIREIPRDCVDEVGLAGSKVFSTIDLTSCFWQQSLEEAPGHCVYGTREGYSLSVDCY